MTELETNVDKRHFLSRIFKGDGAIWTIYAILSVISLIEVYSATSRLTYNSGIFWLPVLGHAVFLFFGLVIVIVIHNIPCRFFKFYPVIFLPISLVLLFILLVAGISTNGASRWFYIFGFQFQPSEMAKGAVVVFVALVLSAMQTEKGADRHACGYILSATIVSCLFILPENFSTAALLFLVVVCMMFIGRVPAIQLGKLLGSIAIIAFCAITVLRVVPAKVFNGIPKLHRLATWQSRLDKFSDHNVKPLNPKDFSLAKNEQVAHANIAIATSNVFGKFPGNSVERDFLSQAFSDFIYAIIIEEMGLFGGVVVMLLYIILLFRASKIANSCERNFPAFLVLGLSLLLVMQALVNMGVSVGIMPVTGQPLPLISKGGTSILFSSVYIGMILSVSRFAKKRGKESRELPSNVNDAAFTDATGMM